ncbi:uncharacterized protein [Clytia hemisphaerica]|uniref:uncharacterized protein n=1 Tax=Clytia hemisphaerica TaxID=252671 RepID=UPI0034D6B17D
MSTISFIRCYFEGIGTVLLIEFIIFMVYRYSKQRNKDVNQDLSLTTVNANQNAADITDDEVAAPGDFQSNGMDTRTHALSIVNATYMSLKRTKEKSLYEV